MSEGLCEQAVLWDFTNVEWRSKNITMELYELLSPLHPLDVTVSVLVVLITCMHLEVVWDNLPSYWESVCFHKHKYFLCAYFARYSLPKI